MVVTVALWVAGGWARRDRVAAERLPEPPWSSRPELVAQAAAHIHDTGRPTLDTLLDLLGALRLGQPGPAATSGSAGAPPRLDDSGLAELVQPLRAAGAPVTVEVRGDPPCVPGESKCSQSGSCRRP